MHHFAFARQDGGFQDGRVDVREEGLLVVVRPQARLPARCAAVGQDCWLDDGPHVERSSADIVKYGPLLVAP